MNDSQSQVGCTLYPRAAELVARLFSWWTRTTPRAATNHASIIIADCANRHPNVFYEPGLAHALRKEIMLLTQTLDDSRIGLRHLCE